MLKSYTVKIFSANSAIFHNDTALFFCVTVYEPTGNIMMLLLIMTTHTLFYFFLFLMVGYQGQVQCSHYLFKFFSILKYLCVLGSEYIILHLVNIILYMYFVSLYLPRRSTTLALPSSWGPKEDGVLLTTFGRRYYA